MNLTDANRPLRVFDKILEGGLGPGNLGVLMSRHGTGKLAVLTSITLDHALHDRNTLHVALNESVSDVRAYHDEVLHAIIESLDLHDHAKIRTQVERHKQIYTYRRGGFNLNRFETTLEFLRERAEFRPELIELQGWPEFSSVSRTDFQALKRIAQTHECQIWLSAHTKRDDALDNRGIPEYFKPYEDLISVIVALEPENEHVNLRFVKSHDRLPPDGIHLEFDPKRMLIRWH